MNSKCSPQHYVRGRKIRLIRKLPTRNLSPPPGRGPPAVERTVQAGPRSEGAAGPGTPVPSPATGSVPASGSEDRAAVAQPHPRGAERTGCSWGLLRDMGSPVPKFSPHPGQGTSFSEMKLVLLSNGIKENNQPNFTRLSK